MTSRSVPRKMHTISIEQFKELLAEGIITRKIAKIDTEQLLSALQEIEHPFDLNYVQTNLLPHVPVSSIRRVLNKLFKNGVILRVYDGRKYWYYAGKLE